MASVFDMIPQHKRYDWNHLMNKVTGDNDHPEFKIHDYVGVDFPKLSPWIFYDNYCAFRHLNHTTPHEVMGRVAFIEKTARIRKSFIDNEWKYGYRSSDYGESVMSMMWCDYYLIAEGYEYTQTMENIEIVKKTISLIHDYILSGLYLDLYHASTNMVCNRVTLEEEVNKIFGINLDEYHDTSNKVYDIVTNVLFAKANERMTQEIDELVKKHKGSIHEAPLIANGLRKILTKHRGKYWWKENGNDAVKKHMIRLGYWSE